MVVKYSCGPTTFAKVSATAQAICGGMAASCIKRAKEALRSGCARNKEGRTTFDLGRESKVVEVNFPDGGSALLSLYGFDNIPLEVEIFCNVWAIYEEDCAHIKKAFNDFDYGQRWIGSLVNAWRSFGDDNKWLDLW